MTAAEKRKPPVPAAFGEATATAANRKPQHSEFQGLGNGRAGKQAAPTWAPPRGWFAAELIDAATKAWGRQR